MNENKPRILVVDDERPIRRFLSAALGTNYQVFEASNGEEAIAAIPAFRPDLIILDIGLPDISGVEVTRHLREWISTPIIIISVREQESEKIDALDAGADDYLTKPFGAGELMARIRVALRHTIQPELMSFIKFEHLEIDLVNRLVNFDHQAIQLTPTEYDLLKLFVQHAGKVLTHRQLLATVWGPGYEDDRHILQVNISNLRHKIEIDPTRPTIIVTEPGVGYRLRIP